MRYFGRKDAQSEKERLTVSQYELGRQRDNIAWKGHGAFPVVPAKGDYSYFPGRWACLHLQDYIPKLIQGIDSRLLIK